MTVSQASRVQEYRERTFRLNEIDRIKDPSHALDYIDERGFVLFWPVKGITFPSLWSAVAGDRAVPSEHDDPGHITWGWKDQALGERKWYYAKVLRNKATFISLSVLPYFYALSDNYGSPDEDYLITYQDGRLSLEEKMIYELILDNGPMHTIELKQASHMSGMDKKASFNRALEKLQSDFRILPVGVAQAGTWKYAFIYDLTSHHYPDLPFRAHSISEWQARKKLVEYYFLSMGASDFSGIQKLFRWDPAILKKVLIMLQDDGYISSGTEREGKSEFQFWLPELDPSHF